MKDVTLTPTAVSYTQKTSAKRNGRQPALTKENRTPSQARRIITLTEMTG